MPGTKVIRLAFGGLIPIETIWQYDAGIAGSPVAYAQGMMAMFAPSMSEFITPLDAIRDVLLQCSSIEDVRRVLATRRTLLEPSLHLMSALGQKRK